MKLKNLKTKILGKNVFYFKEIDSTQNEIWRMIKNSGENGSLVIADIQISGKGTHGRVWHTDESNNIAFSFFLELNCNIQKLNGLTHDIAEIIIEIFKDKYGIELSIKEPNDIVANNKKIGGILTETKVLKEKVKFLVVGIGLNTSKKYFTDDLENIATSIKNEFDIDVDIYDFIGEFCNRFENEILKRMED